MNTILAFLLGPNGIFAVLMAVIIAAAAWARKNGKDDARAEQAASEAKARDIADEIDDAVAGRDPDANRKELKRWGR